MPRGNKNAKLYIEEKQKNILKRIKKLRAELKFEEHLLYEDDWQDAVSDGAIVCGLDEYVEYVHDGVYPSLDGVEYGYGER